MTLPESRRPARAMPALAVFAALALGLSATACGGQAASTDDDTGGSGWVVLDEDISLDGLRVEGASEPVAPAQMSQAEAAAVLPFAIELPAWAPDGFVLNELVEVVAPEQPRAGDYASLILTWQDGEGADVQLQVSTAADSQPHVGAAGLGQEVTINGQPGTLLETQGFGPARLSLAWTRAGLNYRLTATGGTLAGTDLLRMAESIA